MAIPLLLALARCALESVSPDGISNHIVSRDTVWTPGPPILIRGKLEVRNATLTIEAGTAIEFTEDAMLVVGSQGSGNLIVQGTADAPVVLRPHDRAHWGGVALLSTGKSTRIAHLTIRGGGNDYTPALKILRLDFPIANLRVERALGNAISIGKAKQEARFAIRGLFAESLTGHALEIGASALALLPNDMQIRAGKSRGILLTRGTLSAPHPVRLADYGVPYFVQGNIELGAPELSLGPGSTFLFAQKAAFSFGSLASTRLIATGCTFSSQEDSKAPGQWMGLRINSMIKKGSRIAGCAVEAGGYTTNAGLATYDVPTLTLEDCRFVSNLGYGLLMMGKTPLAIKNCAFEGNTLGEQKHTRGE